MFRRNSGRAFLALARHNEHWSHLNICPARIMFLVSLYQSLYHSSVYTAYFATFIASLFPSTSWMLMTNLSWVIFMFFGWCHTNSKAEKVVGLRSHPPSMNLTSFEFFRTISCVTASDFAITVGSLGLVSPDGSWIHWNFFLPTACKGFYTQLQ